MSNKRTQLLSLLLFASIAVTIPLVVLGARKIIARDSSPHSAPTVAKRSAGILPLATQEHEGLTALVFTVRPSGFTPDDITVAAGRYLIVLQNRSGSAT